MPYEREYTKEDLENDIFLPKDIKERVKQALFAGKSVSIVHSSYGDSSSDYSKVILDGEVVHHQEGY